MGFNLVMMGPPGAGEGTQAVLLARPESPDRDSIDRVAAGIREVLRRTATSRSATA